MRMMQAKPKMKLKTVLAIGAVTVTACGGAPEPSPVDLGVPVGQTTAGALEGVWADEAGDVSVFRGVAFARPPVGDLRWRPPDPVESWDGTRMATEFGPACWQARNSDNSPYARGELPRSEDCLTLNVWTPSLDPGERLPVMVWFHGGGHSSGVGSAKIFDGTAMARKGVIMVTANYRLGPARVPRPPGVDRRVGTRVVWQLRHPRPRRHARMGARQHRGIRRRPRERDDLRPVRWIVVGLRAPGLTAGERAVPQSDRPLRGVFRRSTAPPVEDRWKRDGCIWSRRRARHRGGARRER